MSNGAGVPTRCSLGSERLVLLILRVIHFLDLGVAALGSNFFMGMACCIGPGSGCKN